MLIKLLKKIFISRNNKNSNSNEGRELYIGNIHYHVRPHELRKLFEEYGDIESIKIIRCPKTKRSKGYGFVKFYEQNDASHALEHINSTVFRGRELCVAYAKDS